MSANFSTLSNQSLNELKERFGENFSQAPAVLAAHSRDENKRQSHPPEVVIFANNEQDIIDTLKLASRYRCPVTAFAAGSSLEGQILPVCGGISLDLSNMNKLLSVEPHSFQATLQAAVSYPQLNRQLRQHGLFFPVDPGAEASLGGMAATNASGTGAVRYGTTRDNVLAMRVVLADGQVIEVGSKARKTSAGYDLKHLFIGSEGTLGIISELTVKLWPLPENLVVLRCCFEKIIQATQCAVSVMNAALQPERLELIDSQQIHAVNHYKDTNYPEKPTLWIELSSYSLAGLQEKIHYCREICQDSGATQIELATAANEREIIWQARHHAHYAMSALYPEHVRMSTDLCVPLQELPTILQDTLELCQKAAIPVSFVGHVGDGNFHALFHAKEGDQSTWEKIYSIYDELVQKALAVGGTCTGEHGIGLNKKRYLAWEHAGTIEIMQQIKQMVDPLGILNPSKIFD